MALKNRRADPPIVTNYNEFKSPLREDFDYMCVYCGLHENELGGPRLFAVEHLKPKGKFPDLKLLYTNTLYACAICNSFKGEDWPSDNPIVDGRGYIDPCAVDYGAHFELDPTCKIVGKSLVGRYMARRLRLGRRQLSKRLKSRLDSEHSHEKALTHIDRVIELLAETVLRSPIGSPERLSLVSEIKSAINDRNQIVTEWKERWCPEVDLDDYRDN
jgi:hypothetical protein